MISPKMAYIIGMDKNEIIKLLELLIIKLDIIQEKVNNG